MILCIDDEVLGLQIRKVVLERAGYRVVTATDGPTGLSLFADQSVGAVVLDYFMPAMDGGQVAAEMRRLQPDIPIILLSAHVNLPTDVTRVVNCTILKGDGPDILLAKVRELLPTLPDRIAEEALG